MSIYDLNVKDASGSEVSLADYKGKVLLIVNTATGCGFTPQYEGLEALYEKYRDQGFEILDFPCNQFGNQAPGTNEEIVSFCQLKYNVSFKTFAKIDVNGQNEIPLYTWLKEQQPEEEVKGAKAKMTHAMLTKISKSVEKPGDILWNFTKFLVDRDGNAVKRFDPTVEPAKIDSQIAELI